MLLGIIREFESRRGGLPFLSVFVVGFSHLSSSLGVYPIFCYVLLFSGFLPSFLVLYSLCRLKVKIIYSVHIIRNTACRLSNCASSSGAAAAAVTELTHVNKSCVADAATNY